MVSRISDELQSSENFCINFNVVCGNNMMDKAGIEATIMMKGDRKRNKR